MGRGKKLFKKMKNDFPFQLNFLHAYCDFQTWSLLLAVNFSRDLRLDRDCRTKNDSRGQFGSRWKFLLPTHATLGAVELAAPAAFSRP